MTNAIASDPLPLAARSSWRSWLARIGPFLGLLFVFALFSALRPRTFLTTDNIEVMLLQTAVVATAALGMTLVIISGGIDLSVASNIALCTVVIAQLLNRGASPAVAALGGIAMSAACGLFIGGLVTLLRLPPFIVTLGTWGAYRGLAKGLADNTMVSAPETWLNALLDRVDAGDGWMLFPPGVWLTLVLAVVVSVTLRYTRFGRHVFAIGSNEQTARLCGVGLDRTKLLIYVTAGALAGVAGVLQFSYLTVGDPTTAAGLELDIIAAVVIGGASLTGGQGNVIGTLIGAMIMTIMSNGCNKMGFENWVQEIVTGGVIILAATVDRIRRARL